MQARAASGDPFQCLRPATGDDDGVAEIVEAVRQGFNLTTVAEALHTSQPGISKQIRLLEEELGLTLFVRDGRALKRLTPAGEEVAARALRMLREAQALKSLAKDLKQSDRGSLAIGTTHTQARYVLPQVIRKFRERYPDVDPSTVRFVNS